MYIHFSKHNNLKLKLFSKKHILHFCTDIIHVVYQMNKFKVTSHQNNVQRKLPIFKLNLTTQWIIIQKQYFHQHYRHIIHDIYNTSFEHRIR